MVKGDISNVYLSESEFFFGTEASSAYIQQQKTIKFKNKI